MPKLLQDFVTLRAKSHSQHVAVVWKNERIPYGELDRLTSQIANQLQSLGCQRGDRVASLVPKSPNAILTMIGTLKADCVCVPVDVDCPAARVARIVDACEPKVIVVGSAFARLLDEALASVSRSDQITVGTLEAVPFLGEQFATRFTGLDVLREPIAAPDAANIASDASHILFSFSSTGTPKGIVITHQGVMAFVEWAASFFAMDDYDRVSGHSPLHLNGSLFDIFGAFAAGAELHLVPTELNLLPLNLADFIRSHELTQWFSTPTILKNLARFDAVKDGDFPPLKRVLCSGDTFPAPTMTYLMQRLPLVQFTKLSGPTEATIASSFYTVQDGAQLPTDPLPTGEPCAGAELFVLDAELRPVPSGETGELYVGGAGLSPGYWQDPVLTAANYITHPVTKQRLFKTGEIAKLDHREILHVMRHAETPIQCRGYRLELGEIEAALRTLPVLQDAVVVAIDSDDFDSQEICCAFVPKSGVTVTIPSLKRELAKLVPHYMVPQLYLRLDELPLCEDGLIDRFRLRASFCEQTAADAVVAT